jgi:hypothetical protein
MGKSREYNLSLGDSPNGEVSPRVKFDFGPLKPKRPQWSPKIAKAPELKLSWETAQK